MRPKRCLTTLLFGLVAVGSASCGDGITHPFHRMGLHIISGGGGRDTVGTRLATPLVAQYRDSTGRPRAGVQLRIESLMSWNGGAQLLLGLGANSIPNQVVIHAATDAAGQVTVSLGTGTEAGIGYVRVTAPALRLTDSARFEVLPGAAVRVAASPIDTALYVGAAIQFRARTFDRWNNERSGDAVQWSSTSGVIATNASGRVQGVAHGRAFVRAALGSGVRDSVGVSVVPQGVIAALFVPVAWSDPETIFVFETNGSNVRRIEAGTDCAHSLQWSHTQDRLFLGSNPAPQICFTQRLFSMSMTGAMSRVRPDTGYLDAEYWPRLTRDDQWIYFTGRPDHQNGEIWRVRANGTGAELMGPAAGWYDTDQQPSPSPNGAEVVYASARTSVFILQVLDVATRSVRSLGVEGHSPSWSPTGNLIAFQREDVYYVMNADGSNVRRLVESRYSAGYPDVPSWSPDGRWVVVVTRNPGTAPIEGKLALVDVTTGTVLPLGWTQQYTHPSWKPGGN